MGIKLSVYLHTIEARWAIENGADYLGVGPIFPTSTKRYESSARNERFSSF